MRQFFEGSSHEIYPEFVDDLAFDPDTPIPFTINTEEAPRG